MFKKKEEKKVENKKDPRVKIGFSFYPDTNQILITYLQNCDSLLAARYMCDRIFHQIDVNIKLNETETFEDPAEKHAEKHAEAKAKADKIIEENAKEKAGKEEKKEQTKEEKAQEIRVQKVADMKKKREAAAIKFIAILDREVKQIVVKNSQNCKLPYWVNYMTWRVKEQSTTREIAQATTVQLIESIIKDKKKQNISVPGA